MMSRDIYLRGDSSVVSLMIKVVIWMAGLEVMLEMERVRVSMVQRRQICRHLGWMPELVSSGAV